jgi:hypothetical protein
MRTFECPVNALHVSCIFIRNILWEISLWLAKRLPVHEVYQKREHFARFRNVQRGRNKITVFSRTNTFHEIISDVFVIQPRIAMRYNRRGT